MVSPTQTCKAHIKRAKDFLHISNTISELSCWNWESEGFSKKECIACELFLFLASGALLVCGPQ